MARCALVHFLHRMSVPKTLHTQRQGHWFIYSYIQSLLTVPKGLKLGKTIGLLRFLTPLFYALPLSRGKRGSLSCVVRQLSFNCVSSLSAKLLQRKWSQSHGHDTGGSDSFWWWERTWFHLLAMNYYLQILFYRPFSSRRALCNKLILYFYAFFEAKLRKIVKKCTIYSTDSRSIPRLNKRLYCFLFPCKRKKKQANVKGNKYRCNLSSAVTKILKICSRRLNNINQ